MKTETPINMRSLPVHFLGKSRYVPLPRELWQSAGRCDCKVCQGATGYYDTLGVPENGPTWLVHWPELQGRSARP